LIKLTHFAAGILVREIKVEEQTERKVHLLWAEAWQAETERERAKQAGCKPVPPSNPLRIFAAKVYGEIPKLKATALRFLSVRSH
jgi:hypothetical protein